MELWFKLLFGNPIGLMSVTVVALTFIIVCYLLYMVYNKSKPEP